MTDKLTSFGNHASQKVQCAILLPGGYAKVTDDEFIFAISRLGVDILSRKAAELVKRPATQAQVTAYHRALRA